MGFLSTQIRSTVPQPFVELVGRSGLDPGTLECSRMSRYVSQRSDLLAGRSGKSTNVSTEVLSPLNSWLESWLDQGSFEGQATTQFRGNDGEVFELQLRGIKGD